MKKFHITVNGNAYEVDVEEIGAASAPAAPAAAPAAAAPAAPAEAVKVVLWHTLTDHHQAALDKIIADFNASQTEYVVVAEQQPYSEFDAKLLADLHCEDGPENTDVTDNGEAGLHAGESGHFHADIF